MLVYLGSPYGFLFSRGCQVRGRYHACTIAEATKCMQWQLKAKYGAERHASQRIQLQKLRASACAAYWGVNGACGWFGRITVRHIARDLAEQSTTIDIAIITNSSSSTTSSSSSGSCSSSSQQSSCTGSPTLKGQARAHRHAPTVQLHKVATSIQQRPHQNHAKKT